MALGKYTGNYKRAAQAARLSQQQRKNLSQQQPKNLSHQQPKNHEIAPQTEQHTPSSSSIASEQSQASAPAKEIIPATISSRRPHRARVLHTDRFSRRWHGRPSFKQVLQEQRFGLKRKPSTNNVPAGRTPKRNAPPHGSLAYPPTSQQHPRPYEEQPHTPASSPPPSSPAPSTPPATPPDTLPVTPRRCPPQPNNFPAPIFVVLKERTTHLATQIAAFTAHLARTRNVRPSHSVASKAALLEEIVATMEQHANEMSVMDHALRDVIADGSGDLVEVLRCAEKDLTEQVGGYEGRMRVLAERLDPEAVDRTVREMGIELEDGI